MQKFSESYDEYENNTWDLLRKYYGCNIHVQETLHLYIIYLYNIAVSIKRKHRRIWNATVAIFKGNECILLLFFMIIIIDRNFLLSRVICSVENDSYYDSNTRQYE